MRHAVVLLLLLGVFSARALTLETAVPGLDFVRLTCADPGGWTFNLKTETDADGVSVVKIGMSAPEESTPPKFSVRLGLPGVRADHVWSAFDDRYMLYAVGFDAENRYESQLAYRTPLITVFDDDNRNTIALACSEALRKLKFGIGISERTCVLRGAFYFFEVEEPPMKDYAAEIRIDRRDCFWAKAVSEASDWITSVNGFTPCRVPEAAFDPLYSSWYAFWQDVDAASIEREIPIAASLGMKTAILDDGWQKKESASFYSATGDWMPFAGTFPDMKRHVDFVHQAGLKYMLWLSVPYVGDEAVAWKRFEGKFLRINGETSPGRVGVLDPRFPEVREYLIQTYERAVRDWGYDGLKLDFIDQFVIKGEDPAVGQKFAGRDIRSLPLAVDRLMKDVVKRLSAINPDVLIEFRQQYMGPAIRQYGNMIRATDSPADSDRIRKQIADLRLTSGNTAVHADMLAWSREETPERAARPILNSLFSVIQYSMKLDGLPESHRRVIRNWIDFTQRHRASLVKGAFRPYHPELLYPRLEGESDAEKVIALYSTPQPVDLGNLAKPVVLVNATFETSIPVVSSVPATARLFDVFGQEKGVVKLAPGVQMLQVPVSGSAEFTGAQHTAKCFSGIRGSVGMKTATRGASLDTRVVQDVRGYNAWPMIQAFGEKKLVCSYSRDSACPSDGHTIHEGTRDVYAKVSCDGGMTWSAETTVAADQTVGEVNEGIGLDPTGAVLAWVRCWGDPAKRRHELYRSTDGVSFEKIATLRPDPFPMQVTDPIAVPGLGLVSPWFAGDYVEGSSHSWGLLVSADGGHVWEQRTVESGLSLGEWVTEPSLVSLGNGRLLIIGRCEQGLGKQFQVTSTDGGRTWRKARTNIGDVRESTPSLVYDPKSDTLANYYYHRGARLLKRRIAKTGRVFDSPECWPEPEILAEGFEPRIFDAGNVNVTRLGDGTDCCAWYTGTSSNASVVVTVVEGCGDAL